MTKPKDLLLRRKKKNGTLNDVEAAIKTLNTKVSILQEDIGTFHGEPITNQKNKSKEKSKTLWEHEKKSDKSDNEDHSCQTLTCPTTYKKQVRENKSSINKPPLHNENSNESSLVPPFEGRDIKRPKVLRKKISRGVQCELIPADKSEYQVCVKCYQAKNAQNSQLHENELKNRSRTSDIIESRTVKSKRSETQDRHVTSSNARTREEEKHWHDERSDKASVERRSKIEELPSAVADRKRHRDHRSTSKPGKEITIDSSKKKESVQKKDNEKKRSLSNAKIKEKNKEKKKEYQQSEKINLENAKVEVKSPKIKSREAKIFDLPKTKSWKENKGEVCTSDDNQCNTKKTNKSSNETGKNKSLQSIKKNIFFKRKSKKIDRKVSAINLTTKQNKSSNANNKKIKSSKNSNTNTNEKREKVENTISQNHKVNKTNSIFGKKNINKLFGKKDSSDNQYQFVRKKLVNCASELNELVEKISELFRSTKK